MTRYASMSRVSKVDALGVPAALMLGGCVLGLAVSFWPGQSDATPGRGRTAKSVAWYGANLSEARTINRVCFSADVDDGGPDADDCQNALKALNLVSRESVHSE